MGPKHNTQTNGKKNLFWIMLVLSTMYFVLLIFPNMQGTDDYWMLAVFEIDEFAQYSHVLQMHNPAENLMGMARNFLVYDHYFYGYPFYFFSGIALFPIHLLQGEGWMNSTTLIVTALRQLVNVLPNLLSIWLLTYVGTKYKHFWKTLGLFTFLLISPALLKNGLWWHPDGLGLLFASLTMFFLTLDHLSFKKFFWLAAISAGIAFGIKYTGVFFILTIPIYLFFGILRKTIPWKKALLYAGIFVVLMLATIVITNPLLLTGIRSQIIENQQLQFSQTSEGIFVRGKGFLDNGRLPEWFVYSYGSVFFLLLLLAGFIIGVIQKHTRIQTILLGTWIIPYSIVVLNSAALRSHYWLPILLPACILLPELIPDKLPEKPAKLKYFPWMLVLIILSIQTGYYLRKDIGFYKHYLHKEETSVELQFSNSVKEEIIQPAPGGETISIYRDWHIYYPNDETTTTFMDWNLADYGLINEKQPDYLLLEKANVITYGDPAYLDNSPDAQRIKNLHTFYADALNDQLEDYRMVYQDDFGIVYQKEE